MNESRPTNGRPENKAKSLPGRIINNANINNFPPMDVQAAQLDLLKDLEARHEELIAQLDELDKRVAKALVESQKYSLAAAETN